MAKTYLVLVTIEGEITERPNYQETEVDLGEVIQEAVDAGRIRNITSATQVLLSPSKLGDSNDYERCSATLHRR